MKQYSGLKKRRAESALNRLQKQLKTKSKTSKGTLDVKVPLCKKDLSRIKNEVTVLEQRLFGKITTSNERSTTSKESDR